jgi:hypothetical protein
VPTWVGSASSGAQPNNKKMLKIAIKCEKTVKKAILIVTKYQLELIKSK